MFTKLIISCKFLKPIWIFFFIFFRYFYNGLRGSIEIFCECVWSFPPCWAFFTTTISGITNGLFARIIPLYADTTIGIQADVALPTQGTIANALGSSGNAERRVSTFRGFPKLPTEFFPYGIFVPQS
jgi:hypothetical protein